MDLRQLSSRFEKLSVTARLQDTAYFMRSDEATRIQLVQTVLGRLDPGVYLVGAGPYTQGIYSLMSDEIVIGRLATVLENPLGQAIDVFVNDATTLTPREVSRLHCAIYRRQGVVSHDYWLIDRGSTCGTFLNGQKLEAPKTQEEDEIRRVSQSLSGGDVISLGSSLVNTFMIADLRG
jgi:pSer/pThr/pTyr-binding forkhead associated (FHA) protein